MEQKEKKVGAPKKGIDILPEGWKVQIMNLYEEGASDVEVKALIYKWLDSFSNDLWSRWMDEEPEFSETIKKGRLLSHAWWEYQGRINLKKSDFVPVLWYMNMKNRFGWTDNQKIDHTSQGEKINITLVRG